jgi:hypothetical protein
MSLAQAVEPTIQKEVRPKEAAARIGCSIPYIYHLMHGGELEHRTIRRRGLERGIRLISAASVERYLSQRESKGFGTASVKVA